MPWPGDADLDVSPKAESVTVTVKALYKVAATEAAEADADGVLDIFEVTDDEQDVWKERDAVTVTLTERGDDCRNSNRHLHQQDQVGAAG